MQGLKLTDTPRPLVVDTRRRSGRQIALDHVSTQLAIVKNPTMTLTRDRYVRVEGEEKATKKTVAVKPRPWFWKTADGTTMLQIRLGTTLVEVEKGKPTVVVGPEDQLEKTLLVIADLIKAGKLDEQIAAARAKTRRKKASE
ncbi:hypothetical protein H261_19978 [Paramagnetospirillum caucaseum]|uniref:Uncharacterized protein n=1 Tax=Paramagnetospirillum caucaseum TaxID=1244869 RepID=M2Y4Z3_9PROT|nr:hypothetical protein [Paramagnetospirillum caucaseum]EME68141.1 hypothetical protein H261_19978 [Paramagnetospirillum caucaseum]